MLYLINKSNPVYLPLPLYFSNKEMHINIEQVWMNTAQSLVKNSKILLLRPFPFLTFLSLFPVTADLHENPEPYWQPQPLPGFLHSLKG